MKINNYLLLLLLLPLGTFAQINYAVKGNVITINGDLPAGNIIALHATDSTFIKGTFFLDGNFELTDLNDKNILLKLTSLEFEDTFLDITYDNHPTLEVGEIVVEKSGVDLAEVVVKGIRPVYKQKSDGTVEVLIENTTLSASNSAVEILSKSPEVIVNQNGGIEVFGKGSAIMYLNGKRITDNQLSAIAPANIKKIEIIRNPSAKYDAEGGAVIHITTITQQHDGYQIKLQQNIDYSDFGGTVSRSSVNVNLNKGRFSSNANYSLKLGQDKEVLYTTRDRDAENVFLKTDVTTEWQRKFKNYSQYGLGLQYDLNESSYLSAAYTGYSFSLGGNQLSNNKITDGEGINFYESTIDRDEKYQNNSLSINYNKSIDTLGTTLFVGGEYAQFSSRSDNFITEESEGDDGNASRLLKNLLNLEVGILSGQVDFTKVYTNENALEVGAKHSQVKNISGLDFLASTDGINFSLEDNLSNAFDYREAISAAYLNFKGNFAKDLSYSIGVRSEYTTYDLKLSQIEHQKIADAYVDFFPNLSLNKRFSDNYNVNFSYSARISRPPYQILNPILIYQDPYTSVQGNPAIQAQRVHAFEVNSKLKQTTFKIGYSHYINPFGQTAIRGEDPKSYILKRINYEKLHILSTSLSRSFTYKGWTSTNTISLRYSNLMESGLGFERVTPRPNPYFYTNNRFNLSNSLKAEVTLTYYGDYYTGLHHRNSMYNIMLALEKSYFEQALTFRLIANDILHGFIASGTYNVGETDVYYNRRWSTNYFRFSVNYNFGKLKKGTYKNKSIGRAESDRAQ